MSDFFEFVKENDIFALIETHATSEMSDSYTKYFGGFDLKWSHAIRTSRFGRASGGILLGVRSSLRDCGFTYSFVAYRDQISLQLKTKSREINIIPVYLRGENWTADFNELKSIFEDKNIKNPIVLGDMNVRIGEEQQDIDEAYYKPNIYNVRRSKDKITNPKGKKFIEFCQDENLCILNGRTRGDEEGEFTFASGVGRSVNDLCATSCDFLGAVDSFQICSRIEPDHFPIKLSVNVEVHEIQETPLNLLPKLFWKDTLKEPYQHTLNMNLATLKSSKNILNITDLSSLITQSKPKTNDYRSFKPKEKWFNKECHKARQQAFNELNNFRNDSTDEQQQKYLQSVKLFKKVKEKSQAEHLEDLNRKICEVKTSKDFWDVAKEIRNSKFIVGPSISANNFKQYFDSLLNPLTDMSPYQYAAPYIENPELDMDVSREEIENMLMTVKENKAPGEDRIPYEFLINAPTAFLNELAHVYTYILNTADVNECFLKSIIFPVYKKGDPNEVTNYRAIVFMNCIAKVLMGIVNTRLTTWCENHSIINEYQAGFRKHYSTVDNIFNLTSIIHLKFKGKKKVYAFFVDFKAAFDCVPRKALIYKLHKMGVSSKIVKFIEKVYENTSAAVWTGNEFSEYFNTDSGVKQGCLLSPLLFAMYLNDLHDEIGGGLYVDDLNIRLLKYADDIVLLADDVDVLQSMINNLEIYCNNWGMIVNLSKSKIMVFKNGGRDLDREKWTYKGNEVEKVKTYTYLGVTLTPKLSFTQHVMERTIKAKSSINMTWKDFFAQKDIPLSLKIKLFCAVSRAILCYAAQIWGYAYFEEVNKFLRFFLKKILMLPDSTPTYALMLETTVPEISLYTLELHLNYVFKAIFNLPEHRLPHILSKKIADKNIYFFKEWNILGEQFGIHWSLDNKESWREKKDLLLISLSNLSQETFKKKALESNERIYKHLDFSKGITYLNDKYDRTKTMWIFKIRTATLYLNANIFKATEEQKICWMCNSREKEDVAHFIGRCWALKEFRHRYFGKVVLELEEIINVLNGIGDDDWEKLHHFVKEAFAYRQEEFNF